MQTLQNHLERAMAKSKNNIRTVAKDAIRNIQTTHDRATTRDHQVCIHFLRPEYHG